MDSLPINHFLFYLSLLHPPTLPKLPPLKEHFATYINLTIQNKLVYLRPNVLALTAGIPVGALGQTR